MTARKTATTLKIKQHFTHLYKEKGIDGLTVSDIARASGINRGTFYLHYIDKYDLLAKLENEAMTVLKDLLLEESNEANIDDPLKLIPYTAIYNALEYVKGNFAFFEAITSTNGDPKFVGKFKQVLNELIQTKAQRSERLTLKMKNLPDDYAKEILLSSISAIIFLWIRKGALESTEEIAHMITKAQAISPYELLL